jgi:hypothetical protein
MGTGFELMTLVLQYKEVSTWSKWVFCFVLKRNVCYTLKEIFIFPVIVRGAFVKRTWAERTGTWEPKTEFSWWDTHISCYRWLMQSFVRIWCRLMVLREITSSKTGLADRALASGTENIIFLMESLMFHVIDGSCKVSYQSDVVWGCYKCCQDKRAGPGRQSQLWARAVETLE